MEDLRLTAQRRVAQNGLYLWQLWLQYFAYGGDVGLFELEAYLHGMYELNVLDLELLALALGETAT